MACARINGRIAELEVKPGGAQAKRGRGDEFGRTLFPVRASENQC